MFGSKRPRANSHSSRTSEWSATGGRRFSTSNPNVYVPPCDQTGLVDSRAAIQSICSKSATLAVKLMEKMGGQKYQGKADTTEFTSDRSKLEEKMKKLAFTLDTSLLGQQIDGFVLINPSRFLLKTAPARSLVIILEPQDSQLPASPYPGGTLTTHDHVNVGKMGTGLADVRSDITISSTPIEIKYQFVEIYLFNDLLLFVKPVKKQYYALTVPLLLRSLVVTECEVESKVARDQWISYIQGSLEWLDTMDEYIWTLSAPKTRNSVMRVSEASFPRTRTSVDTIIEFPDQANPIAKDSREHDLTFKAELGDNRELMGWDPDSDSARLPFFPHLLKDDPLVGRSLDRSSSRDVPTTPDADTVLATSCELDQMTLSEPVLGSNPPAFPLSPSCTGPLPLPSALTTRSPSHTRSGGGVGENKEERLTGMLQWVEEEKGKGMSTCDTRRRALSDEPRRPRGDKEGGNDWSAEGATTGRGLESTRYVGPLTSSSISIVAPLSRTSSMWRHPNVNNGSRDQADNNVVGSERPKSEGANSSRLEDRYHNVIFLNCDGQDVCIFEGNAGPDGQHNVLAGNTEKLVERLADEQDYDVEYVRIFVLTHTHIMKSKELLNMLIGRFNCLPRSNCPEDIEHFNTWKQLIQTKVIKVFKAWVEECWEDFEQDSTLLELLEEFVCDIFSNGFCISSRMLGNAIKQAKAHSKSHYEEQYMVTRQLHPTKGSDMAFSLSTPQELAEQMTLFDSQVYANISVKQYVFHIWPPKDKDMAQHSPDLQAFINRFNTVSYWVATEICSIAGDPKAQARMMQKFIETASKCVSLNNYYSPFAIMGGLRFPPVRALKAAWDLVNPKVLEIRKVFDTTLMSPSRNMKHYRDAVGRLVDVSVVPFLPLALKDLVFINDGNDKVITGTNLHNFDKLRMIAKVCFTLQSYQVPPYTIVPKPKLQNYMRTCYVCTDLEVLGLLSRKSSLLSLGKRKRSPTT